MRMRVGSRDREKSETIKRKSEGEKEKSKVVHKVEVIVTGEEMFQSFEKLKENQTVRDEMYNINIYYTSRGIYYLKSTWKETAVGKSERDVPSTRTYVCEIHAIPPTPKFFDVNFRFCISAIFPEALPGKRIFSLLNAKSLFAKYRRATILAINI